MIRMSLAKAQIQMQCEKLRKMQSHPERRAQGCRGTKAGDAANEPEHVARTPGSGQEEEKSNFLT